MLLGTSPGFRKVHVRRPNEKEIYTVNLNTYDMPVADTEWLDKALLSAKDVRRIKGEQGSDIIIRGKPTLRRLLKR